MQYSSLCLLYGRPTIKLHNVRGIAEGLSERSGYIQPCALCISIHKYSHARRYRRDRIP